MARNDPIEHVVIDDFRPGVVSSLRSVQQAGLLELPPGYATEDTVGCIANATGQLVPLPEGFTYYTYTPPTMISSGPGAFFLSTAGLAVSGPLSPSGGIDISRDDVHILYHQLTPGIPHHFDSFEWDVIKPDASLVRVCLLTGEASVTVLGVEVPPPLTKRGVTSVFTRTRGSTFSQPGFPVTAAETTLRGTGGAGPWHAPAHAKYVLYPDTTTTVTIVTDTPFIEAVDVSNTANRYGGQLVAHSGRIIRYCETGIGHGVTFSLESNERIRFTDPPNSMSLLSATQDSIFDPQIPGGYGSWGSISFGELLLIKRSGGALLVEGDVYSPSITRLPGVASTGNLMNVATQSPAGLVYCVENDGAYLWNGGNTSRKINKINDTFYQGVNANGGGTSGEVPPDYGCQTDHVSWNNLVVFTSGWCYDALNDSWWRLANPHSTGHIQWLAAGIGTAENLYTIPAGLNDDHQIEVKVFDAAIPGGTYTWISQPIPKSINKTLDVAEVIVSYSNAISDGTIEIFIRDVDSGMVLGATATFTFGFATIRFPIGARCNGLQVGLIVTGSIRAPTINSISVGYREAGPVGQTQS